MRRIGILCLVTGALMLGGCSLGGQERGDTVAGSDIIIEKHTEEDIEEGPTAPSLSPEEATIEPLQLPLEGVQPLQGRAPVVLAGVRRLQHLGEAFPALPIHALLQLQIVKSLHLPL